MNIISFRGSTGVKRIFSDTAKRVFPRWGAEKDIKVYYKKFFGRKLDCNPIEFTEKIYARMIEEVRHPNPLLSILADKHDARRIVGDLIGDNHLIPVIWSGDDPAKIPFEKLPHKSIAKVTHGSGSNIILTESSDSSTVIKRLSDYLNTNHYWHRREHWYLPIKGRVQIEAFLDDGYVNGPLDYRFWCFDGEPAFVQVDDCKHEINPFYDLAWRKLTLKYRPASIDVDVTRPYGFEKMIEFARILSAGFGFVRVDLFNIDGMIYFGEMTFAPVAGQIRFYPEEWDARLGLMWNKKDPRSVDEWHQCIRISRGQV